MKVWIQRSYKSGQVSELDINEIYGIIWDDISGGRNEGHFCYALYGYIDYNLAKEIVDCSGKHLNIANSAKVMIPQKKNKVAYKLLAEKAGEKPACRKNGQRPLLLKWIDGMNRVLVRL